LGAAPLLGRLAWAAGGLCAFVLLAGLLHTPIARPLLMRLGGCPVAAARMTTAQMETARRFAVAASRGATLAPSRPALGFKLDVTTMADVHGWATLNRIDCEDARAGFVTCTRVSPLAIGRSFDDQTVDELDLGFDARGHLVNVTAMRAHMSPNAAAERGREIASRLDGLFGHADRATGSFDPRLLSEVGARSLAAVQYRYRDYFADVTAMTLPSSGPSLREHYMSAND